MKNTVLNIRVAGVTFEGRQEMIARLSGNEPCQIVPEPENHYDTNALAVHVAFEGEILHIGYIPKEQAKEIAPLLEGEAITGNVLEITGGFETQARGRASYGVRIQIEIPGGDAL